MTKKKVDPIADIQKVIEWARMPKRKLAYLHFPAGPELQAAYWIEWAEQELKPKRKAVA